MNCSARVHVSTIHPHPDYPLRRTILQCGIKYLVPHHDHGIPHDRLHARLGLADVYRRSLLIYEMGRVMVN